MLLLAPKKRCAKKSIQTLSKIIFRLPKKLSPPKTEKNLNFASRTQGFVSDLNQRQIHQNKA